MTADAAGDRKKAVAETARLQQAFREYFYGRPWNQSTLDTSPFYTEAQSAFIAGYKERQSEFTADDQRNAARRSRLDRAFELATRMVTSERLPSVAVPALVRVAYEMIDELDRQNGG